MKYSIEWLIIGFAVFWIVELLAFILEANSHPEPFLEFSLPFIMWGVGAMYNFQDKQKKDRIISEYKRRHKK